MSNNPFRKIPGGNPEEPDRAPEPAGPPAGSLCPFIGAVTVPKVNPRAANLIHRPDVNPLDLFEPSITIMGCQREACAMWDVENGDCSIKLGAQAQTDMLDVLTEVKVALEPLQNFFGKKQT